VYHLLIAYNCAEADRFDYGRSDEGPWDTFEEAARFAENECGVPWQIVDDEGTILHTGNDDRPPVDPPRCPGCNSPKTEPGGGSFWCVDCGMEF